MNISIDIKNIFITKMLKPGTEFKIILGDGGQDKGAIFMDGEKLFSPIYNIIVDYSDEINLNRRY